MDLITKMIGIILHGEISSSKKNFVLILYFMN